MNAAGVSRPGTRTMIVLPGEKPSARFQSVGSIRLPLLFTGIASRGKAMRRPVGVERSATV